MSSKKYGSLGALAAGAKSKAKSKAKSLGGAAAKAAGRSKAKGIGAFAAGAKAGAARKPVRRPVAKTTPKPVDARVHDTPKPKRKAKASSVGKGTLGSKALRTVKLRGLSRPARNRPRSIG